MKNTANPTMTIASLQELHKRLAAHGLSLCGRGVDGQPLAPQVNKFFEDLNKNLGDPEKIRQRNELMARAEMDPAVRHQLCGMRKETLSNYIYASNNILSAFFDITNLADDEWLEVVNETIQETSVTYIGADGGIKNVKVVKDAAAMRVVLRYITSQKVTYRRTDIYTGSIVDAALKTLDMGYDLRNQIDALCWALLTDPTYGAFGTFRYFGDGGSPLASKSQYVYVPNTRIVTGNLPTTNSIVLSDNTDSTSFRFKVIQAAIKYFGQWGGCFSIGDLVPTGRILLPGADAADIMSEIVPSGNTNNPVANELLTKGWTKINYGRAGEWTLQTDNTLPPGACYFEANRKPGHACFKPSQDREVVKGADDYTLMQTNEEERWAQKPFGAYINQAERMNVLRVVYRTVTTPTDITQPALHAQPSGDTGEVLTPSVSLS